MCLFFFTIISTAIDSVLNSESSRENYTLVASMDLEIFLGYLPISQPVLSKFDWL